MLPSFIIPILITLPFHLDHNRIVIDARLQMSDGKLGRIKVWVDNGTPDMVISERLARQLGVVTTYDSATGTTRAAPPKTLLIGRSQIALNPSARVEVEKGTTVGAGLEADMNLPSSVLCQYDVLIDYPQRQITFASPGSVHFGGTAAPAYINPENHLIQLAAALDSDRFNLALDVGTPVTFIADELFSKFVKAHPRWPAMVGAVGMANLWGLLDEPEWRLLKVRNLVYGTISFPAVLAVSFPKDRLDYFQKRAGIPTAGLMGAASLLGYRIGIDYTRGLVYFERITKSALPDMDLVGITLRPAADGYTILGVARFRGRLAAPGVQKGDRLLKVNGQDVTALTMGGVWSLLQGPPGEKKELTLQRAGAIITVTVATQCFLCDATETGLSQQ